MKKILAIAAVVGVSLGSFAGSFLIARAGISTGITSPNYVYVNGTQVTPSDPTFSFNSPTLSAGTTTPWGTLAVNGSWNSTTPLFVVATSTLTGSSTVFMINNNGKVAIGTTTPASLLTVINEPVGTSAFATSTFELGDYATTTSRGCVNIKNAAGAAVSFYINAANAVVVENHKCN